MLHMIRSLRVFMSFSAGTLALIAGANIHWSVGIALWITYARIIWRKELER